MSGRLVRAAASRWLPPLLWMAAIFAVSHQPSLPSAPVALLDTLIKKSLHAVAYGILAWLWWRALAGVRDSRVRAAVSLAVSALYAVSDEWHQTFVAGRTGRASDVLIDIAGAVVALAVLARLDPSGRGHDSR